VTLTFLRSYAARVVRNLELDLLTERGKTRTHSLDAITTVLDKEYSRTDEFSPEPVKHCVQQELEEWLYSAIGTLAPLRRKIIALIKLDGLSPKECALRLGLTKDTVKTELKRAMARLRQLAYEWERDSHRNRSDEDDN
jgi:RNA polymerase sigma-19 factor, ECF subfamily